MSVRQIPEDRQTCISGGYMENHCKIIDLLYEGECF